MLNDQLYDVVVIGGGPAGMTAAWELREKKILLLEKQDRLGGRLHSIKMGDYWLNLGGHLFPQPGSHVRNMMSSLGLEVIEIPGNKFAIWFDGKVHSPKSAMLMPLILPLTLIERVSFVRIGLRLMTSVKGWRKVLLPVANETPMRRRERVARFMSDFSFRDFLGRPAGRIDNLFSTALRRAAVDVEDQTAGVGVSLFGTVWGGKGSTALNLKGGSGRLGEEVAKALGERVILGTTVTDVIDEGGQVIVDYERNGQRETVRARQVIVTTPAFVTRQIVKSLPADVDKTLQGVQYGPFVSMGIITDEVSPMPFDDIYAVTTPGASFDMLFNHANPLRVKDGKRNPGGSLMVYRGGRGAGELLKLSEQEIQERFLADLLKIYPMLAGHITETRIAKWTPGNACRAVNFNFDPILEYCCRADIKIDLAGDYFAEIGNMEIAAASAHDSVMRVRERLRSS